MAMNRHRTPPAAVAGRLCAILAGLSLLPVTALGQPRTPGVPSYTSRPTLPGASGIPSRRSVTGSRAPGMTNIGTYLRRPHQLLKRNAFSARIQTLTPNTYIQSPLSKPRQVDVERTLESMTDADPASSVGYSDLMLGHIEIRRRQAMADGWARFHQSDYVRALAAFESAAMVAPNDPTATFGELMSVVANRHHRRALHKLVELAFHDETRPAGVRGMFEFDFSLADAFVSADALAVVLDDLREFAQTNPDNPPVQALYCYVIWYTRSADAAMEARSAAARIERKYPTSPWARFHQMIQEAERHTTNERTSS